MINTSNKVNFAFNEDWEVRNWHDTCSKANAYSSESSWKLGDIPKEVGDVFFATQKESEQRDKLQLLFNMFIARPEVQEQIQHNISVAERRWNKIEPTYFARLSLLLNVPSEQFLSKYNAYFTFSKRCPFSNDSFMFNRFTDPVNNAAHEIMHIEFLRKYNDYSSEKGLSEGKINHLKEILTVLLNEEMGDILPTVDKGYDTHQQLREQALNLYRANKSSGGDIQQFFDGAIELVRASNLE